MKISTFQQLQKLYLEGIRILYVVINNNTFYKVTIGYSQPELGKTLNHVYKNTTYTTIIEAKEHIKQHKITKFLEDR
ncbi:MAG: hypothetical protein COA63_014035 [Methylophaga sp.]|nr:hypothetical protein [Methylophaga sp.]